MQHVSWRPNVTQGYRLEQAACFADSPDCEQAPSQRVRMKFKTADEERGTFVRGEAARCKIVRRWNANRIRSPDGARRNPGKQHQCSTGPGFAPLHPGYGYVTAFIP